MMSNTRKLETFFVLGAIAIFAAAIITARQWPYETALFPVVLAVAGLILACIALAGGFFRTRTADQSGALEEDPATAVTEEQTPQYLTFLWIGGFFAAVLLFGYQWGLTAMALAFYRFEAKLSWVIAGLAAIGCGLFLYGAIQVLNIPLYEGFVFELMG